jgi:(p)ppGpp synthase/HD superfamily hydrolase
MERKPHKILCQIRGMPGCAFLRRHTKLALNCMQANCLPHMETLEKIQHFADAAHGNQMRKYTPERYIAHPLRVMHLCSAFTTDETILASALLHDVLEDTEVTPEDIRTFLFPLLGKQGTEKTLHLVTELTDVYIKRDYPHLNRRKRKQMERARMAGISPEAQTVKYADILDNCREIVSHDPSFARVFLRECKHLLKHMTKGNAQLYKAAANEINTGLQALHKSNTNPTKL